MNDSSLNFRAVGVIGRAQNSSIRDTINRVISILTRNDLAIFVENESYEEINGKNASPSSLRAIGMNADLAIVVGGDGSLLGASRELVEYNIPVVGINLGTLGFLTDVGPNEVENKIDACLRGEFSREMRSLIEIEMVRDKKIIARALALNDVVLHKGENAGMVTLELTIDDEFVCSSRSDGFIISTPTGSTAYALSAGGPIIHPSLRTLLLVPMFPHTLNARPVVVPGSSICSFRIKERCETLPQVSCDGQTHISMGLTDQLILRTSKKSLTLLHPPGYSYFEACRSKLMWGGRVDISVED